MTDPGPGTGNNDSSDPTPPTPPPRPPDQGGPPIPGGTAGGAAGYGSGPRPLPVKVDNPEEWIDIAASIQRQSGNPPVTDLDSLAGFVSDSVQLLFEADNNASPELLRENFSSSVITQLTNFGGLMVGFTPRQVDATLLGTPRSQGATVVRLRIHIAQSDPHGQITAREQFWDVQMGGNTITVGAPSCPNCGAPLPGGALICPYCHTDTRRTAETPLLVIKLERLS